MNNIPTKAKILEGARRFEQNRLYMRQKAPYFPDYYYEEVPGTDEHPKSDHHFACIVRHKHNGIWYARHHWLNRMGEKEEVLKEFLHQVYLDIRFGAIHPEMTDMAGEPLDPVDKLQVSEEERLLEVKG